MSFPLPSASQVGVQFRELAPPTFNNYEFIAKSFKVSDPTEMAQYENASGALSTFGISNPRVMLTGQLKARRWKTGVSVTADSTADTLTTSAAHGLAAGDIVRFGGTPPAPLATGTDYYVIATGLTSTVFKVATTAGGSAVNLSDTGTSPTVIIAPPLPVKGSVIKAADSSGTYKDVYLVFTKSDPTNFIAGLPALFDVELCWAPAIVTEFGSNTPTNIDA